MAQNNKVAETSTIKTSGLTSDQEMMADLIRKTTSSVLSELIPLIQGNKPTLQQTEKTVKEARERVARQMNEEFDRVVRENRNFMLELTKAPKSDYRTVQIPQVYRKYFGSQLVVGVNGSFVTIPVDGRPHRVHKSFYNVILRKLDYEDNKISHMEQTDFSDVLEADRESLGT